MKIINASVSIYSVIIWVVLVISMLLSWYYFDISFFSFMGVSIFFVGQLILRFMTKYELDNDRILVKVWYEKTAIDFSKIRSYSIKKTNWFKQLFLGFPPETLFVKYNRFDDIELLTVNQEIINRLDIKTE